MNRDHGLDTLRGALLLMIAVNHFGGPLTTYTYQPFGYVTGAEGFVLISGIAVGWLARKFAAAGRTDFAAWALRRAGVIYLFHLAVVTGIFALASVGGKTAAFCIERMPELATAPWRNFPAALVLLYQPRTNAILPLYCLLIFAAPWMVRAFHRWGLARVLAGSFLLWLAVQMWWPAEAIERWSAGHGWRLGLKNPWAWQFLFVIGLAAGARPDSFRSVLRRVPAWGVGLALAVAVGLKITLSLHTGVPGVENLPAAVDNNELAWLRLANTLLLAGLAWFALQRLPAIPDNAVAFLGRHSLAAFSFQIVALYALRPYFHPDVDPAWWVVSGSVLLSLSQFLPAWLDEKWRRGRRARVTMKEQVS